MAKVTRDWIKRYVETQPAAKVEEMVGRALIRLLERQTREEQQVNDTREDNAIGFSAADAKSGSITAKTFIKNGKLLDWQLEKWTKPGRNGYPRIAKYARQLNDVAEKAGPRKPKARSNEPQGCSRAQYVRATRGF